MAGGKSKYFKNVVRGNMPGKNLKIYLSKKICDVSMGFKIIAGQINIYLNRKYLLFIRL
jgi:hypothetical protein